MMAGEALRRPVLWLGGGLDPILQYCRWRPKKSERDRASKIFFANEISPETLSFLGSDSEDKSRRPVASVQKPIGRLPRLGSNELLHKPGRLPRSWLLACRAGVHVDFHADRHFDDLRSFPGHSGLPSIMVRCFAPARN